MCVQRTELRAFPRLSCATPARLMIDGADEQASQLLDISCGGCKVLPSRLDVLVEHEYRPGTSIVVNVCGHTLTGRLVWATPNFSALGCAFHDLITQPVLDLIAETSLATARSLFLRSI